MTPPTRSFPARLGGGRVAVQLGTALEQAPQRLGGPIWPR